MLERARREMRLAPSGALAIAAEHARRFVSRLQPLYARSPERLAYHEYPDAEHFMPEAEWNDLWGRTVSWFQRFLGPPQG